MSEAKRISEKGLNLIKEFEGCKLKAYKCPAGVWTIGIGSTLYPNGTKVKEGDTLVSEKAAMELLADTLAKYENAVNKETKVILTQPEFDALVSFTYNVGVGNFVSSTLLKLLNSGEPSSIVAAQFHRWNKVHGKPCSGLIRRREAEAALFLS